MIDKNAINRIINHIRNTYPGEDPVPLHVPRFSETEKRYLLDCIESSIVSSIGNYVEEFERRICKFTSAKHGMAVVNGTAALASDFIGGLLQGVS